MKLRLPCCLSQCLSCCLVSLLEHPSSPATHPPRQPSTLRAVANFQCFCVRENENENLPLTFCALPHFHLVSRRVCVWWQYVCVCSAQLIKTLLGLVMVVSLCGRRRWRWQRQRRPRLPGKLCQSVWRCLLLRRHRLCCPSASLLSLSSSAASSF